MADIIGILLSINANAYSFEAANVRHEHEWKVWRETTLPDGKVILPGVVSHSTNVVEHPSWSPTGSSVRGDSSAGRT